MAQLDSKSEIVDNFSPTESSSTKAEEINELDQDSRFIHQETNERQAESSGDHSLKNYLNDTIMEDPIWTIDQVEDWDSLI